MPFLFGRLTPFTGDTQRALGCVAFTAALIALVTMKSSPQTSNSMQALEPLSVHAPAGMKPSPRIVSPAPRRLGITTKAAELFSFESAGPVRKKDRKVIKIASLV